LPVALPSPIKSTGDDDIGREWHVNPSSPLDEEKHPDYIDDLSKHQMSGKRNWGKRLLITGAVLASLVGGFVLGDYHGTSKTEASKAAEIAELKGDVDIYKSGFVRSNGVKKVLNAELSALKVENGKISTENAALFEMVEELEEHVAGSQSLVDQQVALDFCNADYTACQREKEVLGVACNARVAGLQNKVNGVVVSTPADCDALDEEVASLQRKNTVLTGLINGYDASNTEYQTANQELQAKVLETEGKFAGLEFNLSEKQIALDSCTNGYDGCNTDFDSCIDDYDSCNADNEDLEAQFVVNPYQQITTILNGPEEERSDGLKDLVINYLNHRTVGRKIVVDGDDCDVALGNLYDTIVGEAGDTDNLTRAAFVSYVPQICGDLDPNKNEVEFALTK